MTPETDTPAPDQLAAGSVVFGLASLATCWWFPFGALVGAVGAACGLVAWYSAESGGRALLGMAIAACGTGTGLLLAWNYWQRLLGL